MVQPVAGWAQDPEVGAIKPDRDSSVHLGPTWQHVSVVDAFGWEHTDVTIHWVGQGEALRIRRADGASRVFAANQILHIYDASGNEITAAVAEASEKGHQQALPKNLTAGNGGYTAPVADATLADLRTPAPRLFSFSFDAGIGYATHAGTWFSGLDDGMNYQAGIRIAIDGKRYLHFVFSQQDLGTQTEDVYFGGYDSFGNELYGTIDIEFTLREYQFLIGKFKHIQHESGRRTAGYFEYGFTVMEHRYTTTDYGGAADTTTKLGLVLEGGILVVMSKGVALDLSAGVTWKSSIGEDETGGFLMGARAGLAFMF